MPYYKFEKNDVLRNQVKAYPEFNFVIYENKVYYNKKAHRKGRLNDIVPHVSSGYISLHELNVDRPNSMEGMIYPFVTKQGTLSSFKTISTSDFYSQFEYGDTMTGTYPMSATISREWYTASAMTTEQTVGNGTDVIINKPHILALKNTLNYYRRLSEHYAYTSSYGDKSYQDMNLISIPSIFYGSSIKKGSVELKFYLSGTLIAELKDKKRNGELVETRFHPTASDTNLVAGVVLYNEGFILLTGSWSIHDTHTAKYRGGAGSNVSPAWKYFGIGAELASDFSFVAGTAPSSSFELNFKGTNYIQVLTMNAHARKGMLNYSNNPTYVQYGQDFTSSVTTEGYVENATKVIKNITTSSFDNHSASYKRQTYISKIGIYDKDRNLIAVAKLANPVKKTEERDFTFKMKMDI